MGLKPTDEPTGVSESNADVSLVKTSTTNTVQTTVRDVNDGITLDAAPVVAAELPALDQIATQPVNSVSVSPGSPMSSTSQPLPYNQAPTNAQRPGERLRQARLYQQRELKEVASELKISESVLIAMEADDYKSLPEPTFIRGYLRSYARYLGIDSDILITQFNEIYTSATGLSSNHSLENSPLQQLAKLQSKPRRNSRWLLWISIAVVLVLIVLALRPLVKKVMSSSARSAPAESVVANSSVAATAEPSGNVLPSVTAAPLSGFAGTSTAPSAVSPVISAPSSDQLVLTLSKASGVNVQDSTGKTLVTGQQGTNEPLTLTGVSPFSITLDDADSVSLSLNGEKVDLKPYTVQGKAAFRLSR